MHANFQKWDSVLFARLFEWVWLKCPSALILFLDLLSNPINFIHTRLYFLRADALRDKQIATKDKVSQQEDVQRQWKVENSSNSDDSDFEEFLDWRAKKVSWHEDAMFYILTFFTYVHVAIKLLKVVLCVSSAIITDVSDLA